MEDAAKKVQVQEVQQRIAVGVPCNIRDVIRDPLSKFLPTLTRHEPECAPPSERYAP